MVWNCQGPEKVVDRPLKINAGYTMEFGNCLDPFLGLYSELEGGNTYWTQENLETWDSRVSLVRQ